MRVDFDSLGLFSRLASEGAERAAASLTQLTGVETDVEVTDVTLMSDRDLVAAFDGREFVGVRIGLENGLDGETVLAFERAAAERLVAALLPDREGRLDDLGRSGVEEAANILVGGFMDGWANHLGTAIDLTPPTYVEATGAEVLPERAREAADGVFLFKSRLRARTTDLEFALYTFPERETFAGLTADARADGATTVPVERLSVFDRMTRDGAARAADNISSMTGMETTVDVSRLRFVPVESVPAIVGDEPYAGVVFGLEGCQQGFLVILFDEASARTVAEALLPVEPPTEGGLSDLAESAIKELGNITTSGFIDGWANVLGTSIEHTPPQFVHDMGTAIVSPVVSRLGQRQEYAVVVESTIATEGHRIRCDVLTLPDGRQLSRTLAALDADRVDPPDSQLDGSA